MTDRDWPFVNEAALSFSEHPTLRFVAVTDEHRCCIVALDDLTAVGSLRWLIPDREQADAGQIVWIEVTPRFRRRGVATGLLKAAQAYAEHYRLPPPRHSESRTPSGEAWATSLGATPAREMLIEDPKERVTLDDLVDLCKDAGIKLDRHTVEVLRKIDAMKESGTLR